ncbi:hypothetical protein JOQ06_001708, partial [Pogonophryne albipinna]
MMSEEFTTSTVAFTDEEKVDNKFLSDPHCPLLCFTLYFSLSFRKCPLFTDVEMNNTKKSLIVTSLIVVVSLFVVVVNYSEKPYFLLKPVLDQTFSSHWMFSKQPYKAFKPHLGYVSIPKQE